MTKKLTSKVSKIFKTNDFNLVEVGVIATGLGIADKKAEIQERLYSNMYNELVAEIDKAIPIASGSQLQAVLEYIDHRVKLKPEQRKVMLPG